MQLAGGAAPARRWGPRALWSRPEPQHSTEMYDNTKAGTARHHRRRVDTWHLRPISSDLAAQQGGWGEKLHFLLTPQTQNFNHAD